jgi:hypothetical protein
MKKNFWLKLSVTMIAILSLVGVVFATQQYSPNQSHQGTLGSWISATSNYNRVWKGTYTDYLYLSGGTEYLYTFTGTPTAARTITFPDASGTVMLTAAGSDLYPATAGAYELGTTTYPWKDLVIGSTAAHNAKFTGTFTGLNTITVPDASGTIQLTPSGLTWPFAGASFTNTLTAAQPGAARTTTLPDASGTVMLSTLASNAPSVANSVWAVSNGLNFENAAATFYTQIASSAATANRTFTLPDASGVPVISTLSTNAPTVANSVWASSNGINIENAAATFATTIASSAATGNRTITLPDATGTVILDSTNPTDGEVFISGMHADTVYAGTSPWSRVISRTAAGDWQLRQTSGNNDNTMYLAFHLGEVLRKTTASKGLKITGFKIAHKVTTQNRGTGTVTLKKVTYSTSANSVTDLPVTGTLSTANGSIYYDAFTVTTPYWMVDADSDFVIDVAVAATTSGCVWDVAGVYVTYTTAPY